MTRTLDDPWSHAFHIPLRRLVGAFLVAPLVLAAALTLVVLLLAGAAEPDWSGVFVRTATAALVFTGTLAGFAVTLAVPGAGLLLAANQRGVFAWIGMGALLGAVFAMAHNILVIGMIRDFDLLLSSGLGVVLFLLIRRFAGVHA